jgi:hypothetical protein
MVNRNELKRNLNPHKEAKMAMWLWSEEYANQHGGSMTFYDRLDDYRKRLCKQAVDEIEKINWRANSRENDYE